MHSSQSGLLDVWTLPLQDYLCNKCKRPGHFARDCPNVTVCNNCGLPGHIAAECNSTTMCWNCKESGHLASQCPNDPVCHMCGKMGHLARDCSSPGLPAHDARLCNNCYKPGHIAADCTNEKACNNCHKTGHLARDCLNEPVCNICIYQPGHISRDCVSIVICNNCGGEVISHLSVLQSECLTMLCAGLDMGVLDILNLPPRCLLGGLWLRLHERAGQLNQVSSYSVHNPAEGSARALDSSYQIDGTGCAGFGISGHMIALRKRGTESPIVIRCSTPSSIPMEQYARVRSQRAN
ncbi:Zinc finger protein GIS2 [Vitis vinifera]|uniref:Zinc finger protein GIS2 n=1 Tax=Vitis vinifera TaxID=29760 RepID=A0A438JY92_VITVI|nr:Zinc finger protein GIS2 [Vitis vinifera]